jgi:hypothetical protein
LPSACHRRLYFPKLSRGDSTRQQQARMTTIFTIGHSRHPAERFRALLEMHGVTTLLDVRRKPWSRLNPQFNRG